MKKIKAATVDDLQAVKGIPPALAREVYGYFHPEATDDSKA
jgi:excinuclease UvrABC nuclease subunit